MQRSPIVALARCADYEPHSVGRAVRSALAAVPGSNDVLRPDTTVLLSGCSWSEVIGHGA